MDHEDKMIKSKEKRLKILQDREKKLSVESKNFVG